MRQARAGFTLIELLVVVLIIGILAAIAVPQYYRVVEKGKAAEALSILDSVRGAQDRYLADFGQYCTTAVASCPGFDITIPASRYFNPLTTFAPGTGSPSWNATMTRNATLPYYGAYTILYDVEPGDQPAVICMPGACATDLMPQ